LKNQGNGNFEFMTVIDGIDYTSAIGFIDVNNDGYKDIITGESVYLVNDGSQNFTVQSLPVSGSFVDLDNDEDYDLLHIDQPNTGSSFSWYENNGTGEFSENIIHSQYSGGNFVVQDYDGDGDKDIFSSPRNDNNSEGLILWRNDGNQSFIKTIIEDTHYLDTAVLLQSDFDNDGDVDVLYSGAIYPFTIWDNNSDIPLSVNDVKNSNQLKVFPNPAKNQIIIE